MMMINNKLIRNDFPIFDNNPNLIYLDNASTTHKPRQVLDGINDFYKNYNSNTHRGIYKISEKSTFEYENTRKKIANFIGSTDSKSIVFTSGATESINLIAHSWGQKLSSKDEVLITEMEHHSNIIPWQLLCQKTGAKLNYIPLKNNGTLDLNNIELYISNKTKIVSIIHQSNVFGTINPIEDIIKIAHNKGAIVLIDAAQSIPHQVINVNKLNCDFLVFSGHKMLGPTGVGVLYAKTHLLEEMSPYKGGGSMINDVGYNDSTWNAIPWKFEASTPNIAQVIGLGCAVDYLEQIDMQKIYNYHKHIVRYAYSKLVKIPNITIYGSENKQGSSISFNIAGIHPHDIAQMLDSYNIAIRAGHHCTQLIMKKFKISATNRISFYIYNSIEEIDCLCEKLIKIIKLFKK